VGACAAAALAALVACGVPRRGAALAAIGVAGSALVVFAIGIVLCLQDRPRRGALFSVAAQHAISEVAVMAPFVLALIGACVVLRRQLAVRQRPPDATR
jgi:hypothetical protein